ncbi:MAG TPA: L,D-transpeptidase family protein [Aliidongia sp.]|nr:L,D-transpeptidase family protein [Aliidongia sp.]
MRSWAIGHLLPSIGTRRGHRRLALLAISTVLFIGTHPAAADADGLRERLQSSNAIIVAGEPLDRGPLLCAYGARDFQPVWDDQRRSALLEAIANSRQDGLDPSIFKPTQLERALSEPDLPDIDRELLATDRFLALARAFAQGLVAPETLERDWLLPPPAYDCAGPLAALANGTPPARILQALAPQTPDYAMLRLALARVEARATPQDWTPLADPVKPLALGDSGPPIAALRARLAAIGDLPVSDMPGEIFDKDLQTAVAHFQSRHGIGADGRVGKRTVAALNVAPAARLEQIRLNLERWREMPRDLPPRRVIVNAASATLTLYEEGQPALVSRVVVGKPDHPTPVLAALIEAVSVNPPWKVPSSIIHREILPKLRRDPDYLTRNHYLFSDGSSRLQQLPGPWNALGRIKLELPNPADVYLHDTPARALFAQDQRSFSHGCIRVEAVKPLAAMLLGVPWTPEALDQVIGEGSTRRINLAKAVPVSLVYFTAFVDADGTLEFRDDLYGRDRRLAEALAGLSREREQMVEAGAGCRAG